MLSERKPFREVPDYWDTDAYIKNAEKNIKCVENTIDDFEFHQDKVLVCGRGTTDHPDFSPRFSTPTTKIKSDLYVTVDHSPRYARFITKKGNYALALIVHPNVPKKIMSVGGKIYWFTPEYLNYDLPKISFGKNSGLAIIAIASHFKVKSVLLSGIYLTGRYSQFRENAKSILQNVHQNGMKVFTLNGQLGELITYEKWREL